MRLSARSKRAGQEQPPRAWRSGPSHWWLVLALLLCSVRFVTVTAQGTMGALIGRVADPHGAPIEGAVVRVRSAALLGGEKTVTTNERGDLRFLDLPPGRYMLDVAARGFATFRDDAVDVRLNKTVEVTVALAPESITESIVVEGTGSRIDTRDSGIATRFDRQILRTIPTRRSGMFDLVRIAPGISATSPSGGTVTTISAFGSGTNENTFHIDGTNFTCPCNGTARSEPGVDFIEEIHVQSIGASAEFGSVQGAVIDVVTRQGGDRFVYDGGYYYQTAALTSTPVHLRIAGAGTAESGYARDTYHDVSNTLGGPIVRNHAWLFAGYQHLRDRDSQPGSSPALPRTIQQDKVMAKVTWKMGEDWRVVQSVHREDWTNPEQPTLAKPFAATWQRTARVPAVTFAHLTHVPTGSTTWDVRVGRFTYHHEDTPNNGDPTIPARFDAATGIWSDGASALGRLALARTTAKATVSHFRPMLGADHQLKVGGQVEQGDHESASYLPGGRRFVDSNGAKSEVIVSAPSNIGGSFVMASAFATDAVTVGSRLTINLGLRFDSHRALSPDLRALDFDGRERDQTIAGLGTMYTWTLWSPRLGVTANLTSDARTVLRGSYGLFRQGVLTAELQAFHPGSTATTTTAYSMTTGDYTGAARTVDPRANLQLDPGVRAPATHELSVGIEHEVIPRLTAAVAYVGKRGHDFIGWVDVGGRYGERTHTLPDGRTVPVFPLENRTADRMFLLTNPQDYTLTYDGLAVVVDRARSRGWQMFGSYTWSRASGLQPSSGSPAAAPQASTVAPPPGPAGLTFGRDPNDLTYARGRLPNDRPHMARLMASVEVPGTALLVAANLQHVTGKPWAASTLVGLPQNAQQRILIERRGSRRLSSQTLLDLRVSRPFLIGRATRVELLLDVLNALNDTAEESIASDNLYGSTFGQPITFVDPRRAMVGVRVTLGQ